MNQREIKFRVWDKTKKLISPVAQIRYADDGFAKTLTIYPAPFEYKKSYMLVDGENGILMQFTGLKDKNGKEIYEGDIVKGIVKFPQLTLHQNDKNSNFKMCGYVTYDFCGFRLKVIQSLSQEDREGMVNYFDFIGNYGETFEEIEVIGNIYENPELLK